MALSGNASSATSVENKDCSALIVLPSPHQDSWISHQTQWLQKAQVYTFTDYNSFNSVMHFMPNLLQKCAAQWSSERFQDVKVVISSAPCPKFNLELTKTKNKSQSVRQNRQYHRRPWKKASYTLISGAQAFKPWLSWQKESNFLCTD